MYTFKGSADQELICYEYKSFEVCVAHKSSIFSSENKERLLLLCNLL